MTKNNDDSKILKSAKHASPSGIISTTLHFEELPSTPGKRLRKSSYDPRSHIPTKSNRYTEKRRSLTTLKTLHYLHIFYKIYVDTTKKARLFMGKLKRAFMAFTEDDMGRPNKETKDLIEAELERLYLSGYTDDTLKASGKRAHVRTTYDNIRRIVNGRTVQL